MYTIRYNGMYINGKFDCDWCYVTDDSFLFLGKRFKSLRAAKVAITKARKAGTPPSR